MQNKENVKNSKVGRVQQDRVWYRYRVILYSVKNFKYA